jgi:hypothetical protein
VAATTKSASTPGELRQKAADHSREVVERRKIESAKRRREAVEKRAEVGRRRREAAAKKQEEEGGHGLGATKTVFEANNTMVSQQGTEPPEGTDYYRITETNLHNRITGYEVTIYASPSFSNQQRIALLGGIDLPNDAEPQPQLEHSHCYVWRSALLKRLIGKEYAEGTTEAGTDNARMQAVSSPSC